MARWAIVLLFCTAGGLVSSSYAPSLTSLYKNDGSLTVLNTKNYPILVLSKNEIWMVEFYMSWCGYCQRFAPIYKALAQSIYSWKKLVKVGVIECSDPDNTRLCQHYKITSVPHTKYFHPFNDWSNSGQKALHSYEVNVLKADLIKYITSIKLPNDWPSLSFHTLHQIKEMKNNYHAPFLVIVEPENSTSGIEIILSSTSATRQIKLVRYAFNPQDNVISSLVDKTKLPSLVKVSGASYILEIMGIENEVDNSIKNIQTYLGVQTWKDETESTVSPILTTSEPRKFEDKVYLADLLKALETSLVKEIAFHPDLKDNKVDALRNYLDILIEYFPGRYMTRAKLKLLRIWIGQSNEIIVSDYLKFIRENEIFETVESWSACRGSISGYRGYPCGLWTLFHTLTARAYNDYLEEGNSRHPRVVLTAMKHYIDNFFSCERCKMNFHNESMDMEKIVEKPQDAVLWLWYAHNNINERLKGDITEDPKHPKIQFPSNIQCPSCYDESISKWNKKEVLQYLNKRYVDVITTLDSDFENSGSDSSYKRIPILLNIFTPVFLLFYF